MSAKIPLITPADIERCDRSSFIILMATVLSIAFHVTVLFSVAALRKVSFKKPLQIVPVEVSRLVIEPEHQQAAPKKEEPFFPPEKPEPLPNIVAKRKVIQNKRPRETPKPKSAVTPPPINSNLGIEAEDRYSSSIVPSVEAQLLEQIMPTIPDELKSHQYKSYVRVKVEIAANGVASASLRTSSGNQVIDERVLDALQQWKWRPAFLDGTPVRSVRHFKFEFEVK